MECGRNIKVALAGSQKQIVNSWGYRPVKRAVAAHGQFLVCAVASYHINCGLRELKAVLFVDIASDGEENLRV